MPTAKRSKNTTNKMSNLNKRSNPGKSNAATNPYRTAPGKDDKKGTHFRSRSDIKIVNMMREKPDL
jgi:hypothetical protein